MMHTHTASWEKAHPATINNNYQEADGPESTLTKVWHYSLKRLHSSSNNKIWILAFEKRVR